VRGEGKERSNISITELVKFQRSGGFAYMGKCRNLGVDTVWQIDLFFANLERCITKFTV
jgi:hypothetical protein